MRTLLMSALVAVGLGVAATGAVSAQAPPPLLNGPCGLINCLITPPRATNPPPVYDPSTEPTADDLARLATFGDPNPILDFGLIPPPLIVSPLFVPADDMRNC